MHRSVFYRILLYIYSAYQNAATPIARLDYDVSTLGLLIGLLTAVKTIFLGWDMGWMLSKRARF
jgi:hypothetical protein